MDRAALAAREEASLRAFYAAIAPQVVEVDGLLAAITPQRPRRSIMNGVVCPAGGGLAAALPRLEALYGEAGVRAWLVWLRPGDRPAVRACRAAGLRLDGRPRLMAADLAAVDLDGPADVELLAGAGWAETALVNDAAYGLPPGEGFAGALDAVRDPRAHVHVALADGRPACSVVVRDHAGDAGVYFVATLPELRGRGLATRLMRVALRAARRRGLQTTSLEASDAGAPLYRALGYRELARLEIWERQG